MTPEVAGRPFPRTAAWQHVDARAGFEVVTFGATAIGHRVEGCTTAVEDGAAWIVDYQLHLDSMTTTRRAEVRTRTAAGPAAITVEADGAGRWWVDGERAEQLDGCLDIDLESSAMTNAFPVRRLGLAVGQRAEAPAAYVRAIDLVVERLEQTYVRLPDDGPRQRYDYASPAFDFTAILVYDESGLVLDYPGIATRAL